ncbi:MAG: DNA internalization-related competence protein ComEC/Rec2 [Opitutae bacterium]|nr:DNA internalization-related competence protein ComEC/Rec2 [Opitutae bacterium]
MEWWIEEELQGAAGRMRPPRRRAMVGLAFPVIAGTAAGICAPISPMWFWGAGGLLLLPLFLWVRKGWSVWPLMGVAFCLMAAHARQSTGGRAATSLPALLERPMEYVQFVAVAAEDAVLRPARPGQAAGAVFHARVEGLNRDGVWRRADDRIRVVLRGGEAGARRPRYGERWRLRGIVRPAVPRRAGLFTLPENQAVIDPDRAVFLDGGRGNPFTAWCMERRRACRAILGRGLEAFPEERGLLQALLLGYREDLPGALRRDFAATGTVHIFAISGAHVAMVTLLFAGVLRALGIPLTRWFLFLTPLLVGYTVTTGAATSAIRACVMASLMLAAPFLKRRPDAISALAVAAIVILVAAPAQLGDLGFLLSFTAVAGLLAVQPMLEAGLRRASSRDAWQLPGEELSRGQRWRECALSAVRHGSVTVSAWVSTAPLTAYFFNLFSPVALGMNLLVIPAAFAILMAGVMSLLCAPLGGFGSEVFNHAARAVASCLTFCIQRAADVPGGHWFIRAPPAAGVIAWYGILAAAAVMARRVRGALAAGLGLLAVLALAWGAHDARRCRVSVLDVGEGQAVLVQARKARLLVDSGPEFRAEDTLRLLRGEGVNRLDVLILTHSDAQHMGAARFLMRELPVGELWLPAVLWASPPMREVLRRAETAGIPVRRLHSGESGNWPGNLFWEVFWPPEALKMSCADDASLVMRVARFGASILLAGDAGGAQEKALAASGRSLAASVLLAGRHGDADATSGGWLAAVRPRDAIISAGPHADGRHPDGETLGRLAAKGIRVWRTDQQGTIRIDLAGSPARWPDPGYRIRANP